MIKIYMRGIRVIAPRYCTGSKYALIEVSNFSKHWIPFCKKFNVQSRSPGAYFSQQIDVHDIRYAQEWLAIYQGNFMVGLFRLG